MITATKFGAWSTPQSALEIEYSLVVLEEIRRSVTEGFQRLRGGMEVGGILYGTRDESKLRIEAIRDIICEHAHGPSFNLSSLDHEALNHQLLKDQEDSRLKSYVVLGWFVSHPRKDIALQASDVEIYDRYFPGSWQIALVIRPGRGGIMRAGFFVRDADGHVKADRSYQDFNFPELPPGVIPAMLTPAVSNQVAPPPSPRLSSEALLRREQQEPRQEQTGAERLDRQRSDPATSAARGAEPSIQKSMQESMQEQSGLAPAAPPSFEVALSALGHSTAPFLPQEQTDPPQRSFGEPPLPAASPSSSRANMIRTVTVGIAAALIGALISFAGLRSIPEQKLTEPISLAVFDHAGQLQIQWNHASGALADASKGSLEIEDGGNKQTFLLTPQDLAQGGYTYVRHSGDVQVRMVVVTSHGQQKQEASRFLGAAAAPAEAASLPDRTARESSSESPSSAELDAAREETAKQKTRIQQLERTIVILQGRLGMNP